MTTHTLRDGRALTLRQANEPDAEMILAYCECVAGESDYLSFGPGELGVSLTDERALLQRAAAADNQLFLLALLGDAASSDLVGMLTFSGGSRPRIRHAGEFGMSVRRECWNLGVGSRLLQGLIDWARQGGVVRKINLKVRTDNAAAIRLYERMGFFLEGRCTHDMLLRGQFHDHFCMGLLV